MNPSISHSRDEKNEQCADGGSADTSRCDVCGSTHHRLFLDSTLPAVLRSADLKITDTSYGKHPRLLRCKDCGFVYADALLQQELIAIYEALVDTDYQAGKENRQLQMASILDRVMPDFEQEGNVLDIGAGTGLLVREAQDRGWDAIGVEPSHWAARVAAEENGVLVLQGLFPHPDLGDRKFDLVTLIDVIEHVTQPLELLSQIRPHVTGSGRLVVATPDINSFCARILGSKWWHMRPAHVCFFDSTSMRKALDHAGFDLVRQFRQIWWFPVEYLVHRLACYLPLGWLDRSLAKGRLRRIGRIVMPLNLLDSWVFVARPK